MSALGKLLAITLLALLGQPFVRPFLAWNATDKASLPACCRRNGKHHCILSLAERLQPTSREPQFHAPPEECPYRQRTTALPIRGRTLVSLVGQAIFADLTSQRAAVAQTESKLRISHSRSRQKRGPSTAFFLQLLSQTQRTESC
jgi:hypothetical protein